MFEMKLNKFYNDYDSENIIYFKYLINNEQNFLIITLENKLVDKCDCLVEQFAEKEVTNNDILFELEELVIKYFTDKYKYYQKLANRFNNLSTDIYYE